ncbi:serine/threonine protein kinase [Clostridium aestuarii]|uniref:Serine/threonine protein kinase n=1 Tax=Clostridium aestuarii TaxID=338193 RepID=A0ABT4CVG3_9CLOT|nr:serine/threonine protein kinase [Clostridium aestuarii]MCY6482802.1 serine/threonine protein kinase [Clostridium aestuarii]
MKYKNLISLNLSNYRIIHHSKKEKIYLTPDNKVIKLCRNSDDCRREYLILRYCQHNKYFPKVYEYRKGYVVRDYVDGLCLIDYIKKHGLDESVALSLVDLIQTFETLEFSRLDTGISHIFINKNGEIKVIGLRNNYQHKETYPKHMISGLRKLKVSKKFFKMLKKHHPDLYEKWKY